MFTLTLNPGEGAPSKEGREQDVSLLFKVSKTSCHWVGALPDRFWRTNVINPIYPFKVGDYAPFRSHGEVYLPIGTDGRLLNA